jgi:hypothetical protein
MKKSIYQQTIIYWLFFTFNIISINVFTQTILIQTSDTTKIKKALAIINYYEPEIYQSIITKSIIQFGELPDKPRVNFAISEKNGIEPRYWIMLNPTLMNNNSIHIIATIIVHEAMHLGYSMNIYKKASMNDYEKELKIEHVHIYNYELNFLTKIGASKSDIDSRKRVMDDLKIPIM